jgi:predicted amidophosphoribosyltransferase
LTAVRNEFIGKIPGFLSEPGFCQLAEFYQHVRDTFTQVLVSGSCVYMVEDSLFRFEAIWDFIFPPFCVVCRTDGSWWCEACRSSVQMIRGRVCAGCGRQRNQGHACRNTLGLDGFAACGYYHDPKLRLALQGLKYRGVSRMTHELKDFLVCWRASWLGAWPWAGVTDLGIQPLVGSPPSVRARGFDQAELLAGLVRQTLVPWARPLDALVRRRSLMPQAKVELGLRRANVAGSFGLKPGVALPSSVILVDDVVTSGATMHEAASALRAAGVTRVFGFALALGA